MTDHDRPAARALRVLELVQRHPGITGHDLAGRLGVTDRAVRRYVAVLREAEINIESESGRYGGYRLGRGLRLPPLVFTTREALGLVMTALSSQDRRADGDDAAVATALGKIMRALPSEVSRPAELLRERVAAAPGHQSAHPDPETTSELVLAAADRRRVRLSYRSASGSARDLDVDPWGVVVRHGRWYLLGLSVIAQAVRTYRIDRITAVETLAWTFVPPTDLDPVALLERHLGDGREFSTTVRFGASIAEVAPWITPVMGRLVPLDVDACLLTGTTSNPSMYAGEWLAGVPYPFTVQGGAELREAVRVVAARLTGALSATVRPGAS